MNVHTPKPEWATGLPGYLLQVQQAIIYQNVYFRESLSALVLPPPFRNLARLTKLDFISPSFQPSQHPLQHTNNMRHSTCIGVHKNGKDGLFLISADLKEPVTPEILNHADVHIAMGIMNVWQILQGSHIFHVPVAWGAD